jgi:hypothetical protein
MTSKTNKTTNWKQVVIIGVLAVGAIVAKARNVQSPKSDTNSKTQPAVTFQTPAEAGEALAKAAKAGHETALQQILGVGTRALLTTADTDADRVALDDFASKYQRMNRWVEMSDGSRVLYVGADNFAFPVPLAKNASGQWYFDGVAGAEEIRARKIGKNELLAIDACSALANAEEMYFISGGNSPQYARRIISTPGSQDGLYWPVSATYISSPLGHLDQFPNASLVSYTPNEPLVIDGYNLRILTAQGDDAPGGARSYVVNGRMTRGFAILAAPVKYAETGIMTLIISREGIVYERDLGPDTAKLAAAIQQYNPDENWSPVE